jgi:hypothetical protein
LAELSGPKSPGTTRFFHETIDYAKCLVPEV